MILIGDNMILSPNQTLIEDIVCWVVKKCDIMGIVVFTTISVCSQLLAV